MILADTSVWIEYFNGVDSVNAAILDTALAEDVVVIGDVIFLEILQGFRDDSDYKSAKKTLRLLEQYEMLGLRMAEKCADNYRRLRKSGITIRKTTDVIIATFCIENKLPLLHSDRDFIPFTDYLGLQAVSNET